MVALKIFARRLFTRGSHSVDSRGSETKTVVLSSNEFEWVAQLQFPTPDGRTLTRDVRVGRISRLLSPREPC
jgi:hypothetical protein